MSPQWSDDEGRYWWTDANGTNREIPHPPVHIEPRCSCAFCLHHRPGESKLKGGAAMNDEQAPAGEALAVTGDSPGTVLFDGEIGAFGRHRLVLDADGYPDCYLDGGGGTQSECPANRLAAHLVERERKAVELLSGYGDTRPGDDLLRAAQEARDVLECWDKDAADTLIALSELTPELRGATQIDRVAAIKDKLNRATREAEARAARERELWREYATLLLDEINEMSGIAYAHGWRGDKMRYQRGVELRAALGIKEVGSVMVAIPPERLAALQRMEAALLRQPCHCLLKDGSHHQDCPRLWALEILEEACS